MNKLYLISTLLFSLIVLSGCSQEINVEGEFEAPWDNYEATGNTVETVDIDEDFTVEDEEVLEAEDDFEIGDCPHPYGSDCREDMPVCGSDDRNYEHRCTACAQPQVEWWIEGSC